jgi:hypothetical protein
MKKMINKIWLQNNAHIISMAVISTYEMSFEGEREKRIEHASKALLKIVNGETDPLEAVASAIQRFNIDSSHWLARLQNNPKTEVKTTPIQVNDSIENVIEKIPNGWMWALQKKENKYIATVMLNGIVSGIYERYEQVECDSPVTALQKVIERIKT